MVIFFGFEKMMCVYTTYVWDAIKFDVKDITRNDFECLEYRNLKYFLIIQLIIGEDNVMPISGDI
jgi:hypothetical protein